MDTGSGLIEVRLNGDHLVHGKGETTISPLVNGENTQAQYSPNRTPPTCFTRSMATARKSRAKASPESTGDALLPTTAGPTAEEQRHFRKTNDAIGIRVREGKLTLLTRKVLNALMLNAQEQRNPGVNAPIDTAVASKYFWIPMSDLARDASYDSKDTALLKSQLQEIQAIRLVLEDDRQWTSEMLISSVKIINPTGTKSKHGGRVWLGYSFPPEVHELVMAPGTYTKLNIYYQSLLRTGSALALYEVARRYATNPRHLTDRQTYEHWYVVLTGHPLPVDGKLPPYKYFKRDVINKNIAEINALTDIHVHLIEHKTGRRVTHLQFHTELSAQPQLDFPGPPVIDSELLDKLTALGMSQHEAQDSLAAHGDTRTRGALMLLDKRINQAGATPLDSKLAYLRWALKEGDQALKTIEKSKPKAPKTQPASDAVKTLMDEFMAARNKHAYDVYIELPPDKQQQVFERFRNETTHAQAKKATGPTNAMLRSLFQTWYAKDLYGEPSATDLAEYVASRPAKS